MPFQFDRHIDVCCFCFSVQKGCRIIALLTFIFSLLKFVTYVMTLLHIEANAQSNCIKTEGDYQDEYIEVCSSIWIVRSLLLFQCSLYLLGMVGGVLLQHGITKNSSRLFYPWFLFCSLRIVLNLMSFGAFRNVNDGVINLIVTMALLYFFFVVKYYEHQIKFAANRSTDEQNSRDQNATALSDPENAVPKDNPPPYSVVAGPPPYSACYPVGMIPINNTTAPADANAASGVSAQPYQNWSNKVSTCADESVPDDPPAYAAEDPIHLQANEISEQASASSQPQTSDSQNSSQTIQPSTSIDQITNEEVK